MKQEAGKKSKKWIALVAALAVLLAAAGIALAVFLNPGQQPDGDEAQPGNIYWNVDAAAMRDPDSGLSLRAAGEDGLYHIRFAVDGEQVELAVIGDKRLVNYLDTMDAVCLTMDADGVVVDAVDPKTVYTEVARDFYVKSAKGNTVNLNSSMAMNGMDQAITLTDSTGVYDVAPTAEVVGQAGQCAVMDQVTVYANAAGEVTHVYITEHAVEAEVYWRLEQHSSGGTTTREPDENGVYTIQFAYKGEHVECKSKDKAIVSSIDSISTSNAAFGLVFDEEGYIIDWVRPAQALHGVELCDNYNITEIDGNSFSATRLMQSNKAGDVVAATISEDCEIYLVCDGGTVTSHVGERITQLQMDDRILCITNMDGEAILIYVVQRQVDSPMYYNLSRQYKSSTQETTRTPDANGYYVFELAAQGGTVTVRTKDKAIASRMDSFTNQGMGLKLNGDIVEKVYDPGCVCGWTAGGVGRYVTSLSGTIVSLYLTDGDGNTANAIIRPDCEIYDVTGNYGVKVGSVAELNMYDRITCFKNISGELTHIFITDRYVEGTSLYYNVSRRYNSSEKTTTREPDENGYYVFEMICNGKQVSVKTKSKDMASFIDYQNAPIAALKVSGGIVREAYAATAAVKFGYKAANYHYVDSVTDGKLSTYYVSDGQRHSSTANLIIADDTKIYNVSDGYVSYKGETTSLKKDDRIQVIADRDTGEAKVVFIMDRQVDSPLYWHVSRKYNTSKQETSRTPDAEGYYVFDLAVNGKVQQFKTKDKDIASKVDNNTGAFGLLLSGNVIKQVYNTTAVKGVKSLTAGRYDVMAINGSKVTATRNRPTSSDYGTTLELNFTKDCKVYDVSTYADPFGAKATLELGDRIAAYTNDDGDIVYCYITNKNTRKAGYVSLCEHCNKEVFWEPYAGEILAADNVHYYLTHDYTKSSQNVVGSPEDEENYQVVFDLNGHTLSSNGRGFLVYDTLTILDSAGGGKVAPANGSGGSGGCVMLTAGGKLNLYSGTLTLAEDAKVGDNGGVLYIARDCVFNMYGGTVTGGTVETDEKTPYGGNISVLSGTFNLYGGTVSGGSVPGTGRGGNIYVSNGTFNMEGGTVTGGTAHRGGNIYLLGSAVMNLKGGVIADGVAQDRGGSIFDDGATSVINISGGTVTGGKADGTFGGNICLANTVQLNITGGEVTKGVAAGNGGNIAIVAVAGVANISGGKVTDGEAKGAYGGGNIYLTGAAGAVPTVNISDGTVSGGSAAYGGNIRLNSNAAANISGGTVTGGKATTEGGNISIGSVTSKLELAGGTFTDGSVVVGKDGTTTLSGAPVMDELVITEGITVALGEMTDGADITVTATGAFTAANENAESYKAYFKSADETTQITVKDNVLYCGEEASGGEDPDDGEQQPQGELVLDANGMAVCPVCQENVTWTAISSTTGAYNNTDGGTDHYYLSADLANTSTNTNFMSVTNNGKSCLHLNGHSLSFVNRIMIASGTFNVMGTGSVTGGYADGAIYVNGKASANLLGGSYANSTEGAPAIGLSSIYANVTLGGNATKVALPKGTFTLTGAATADSVAVSGTGKLVVAADWTGTAAASFESALVDNMVPEANGAALGDFTGTLTAADATFVNKDGRLAVREEPAQDELVLDENKVGYCPTCEANVVWTAVTSTTGGYNNTDGGHDHYYLPADLVSTATNTNFMSVTNKGTSCLHLNGHDLSFVNRIYVTSEGSLNIMGTGAVTGGYADGAVYTNGKSDINLLGGTYTNSTADAPAIGMGSINANVTLGANASNVKAAKGTLTLTGTAAADSITVGASGKLVVAADWTGTAVAAFESAAVDGMIPEANGTCEDVYTGSLTLTDGSVVTGKDGRLLVGEAKFDNSPLEFAADGKTAYCPACQKDVEWTAVSGDSRMGYFSGKTGLHYYLSGNVDTGSRWNQFTELANSTACLHLNGHDLTCGGRINASNGSTLNIMGEGTVTCTGAYTGNNAATYVVATLQIKGKATVNLFGGTYKCTAQGLPVALLESNAEAALNVYDAAVIEGTAENNGALVKLGSLNILGGAVHGGIKTHSGTVTLSGNATVTGANGELTGNIAISTTSKLVVKADYKGTASASFGSTITDNLVPEANGAAEGAFEGKLYLEADGSTITAQDGKLAVVAATED